MKPFLIFGRPRSRTAWTANFLTYRKSFCFHEALASNNGSFLLLSQLFNATPGETVGNCDTGLIHCVDAALETFPDARLVVLTENEFSWRTFVTKHSIPEDLVAKVDYDYHQTKSRLKGHALFVPCTALTTDIKVAQSLWNHCTTTLFPALRWEVLRDFNIQIMGESLERRLG